MDLSVTPVVIHLTRLDPAQEGFEPRNVTHLELTTAFTRDINMEVCLLSLFADEGLSCQRSQCCLQLYFVQQNYTL